jgi:signal peptidase I
MTQEKKQNQNPKSAFREWIDSIVFAVVAATLIRFFLFEAYNIPTSSMENSLMVGDFLFVSKMHYGVRTPKTPLQVPLTHQKIWGTNLPSYLRWLDLPIYRLPGFSKPKTGDAIVFNVPNFLPDGDAPTDLRTYYIKRCIGTPGDKLEIQDGQVFLNDKAMENPPKQQTSYYVVSKEFLTDKFFADNDIPNGLDATGGENINYMQAMLSGKDTLNKGWYAYQVNTYASKIEEFKKMPWFVRAEKYITPKGTPSQPDGSTADVMETPMHGTSYGTLWNLDNYGPIVVPKEGMTVTLDSLTIDQYKYVIKYYEGNKNVEYTKKELKIDGVPQKTYTFKQDYYFAMGDNRHKSADSRFWGFVPFDHVVGKAVFIWMSLDPNKGLFDGKIRWSRLFRTID